MNPSQHKRVIDGIVFDYTKTHRNRKGEILWYCYKSSDGRTAYKSDLPSEPTPIPQRGFIYKEPALTLISIAMFFLRR